MSILPHHTQYAAMSYSRPRDYTTAGGNKHDETAWQKTQ